MDVPTHNVHLSSAYNGTASVLLAGNRVTLYFILFITCLIFLILAAKNYYLGYPELASMLFLFVVTACIDAYAFHNNRPKLINLNIVISTLVLSLLLTIYYLGASAISWSWPISIALIYVLPTRSAVVFNSIILSFVSVFSFLHQEPAIAARVSCSLFLTILFTHKIAQHIYRLNDKLVHEAVRDPMTGALNRRQLSTYLQTSIANKKRNNISSAILMFDIDHFKHVNDTYGHGVGDEVIKKLVAITNANSRELDLLFRVGGEEFILLIQDTDVKSAKNIAENLRRVIKETQLIEQQPITISIGIATAHEDITTDAWIKHADTALYQAKNAGRNQVQLYQEPTDELQCSVLQ